MSIDLDRIEFLAKLADDVVVAGYYDGEHLTPATVLALVAAARALPEDPYTGLRNCLWCERHDCEIHADDCRWAIARAAMEGMR